MAGVRFGCGEFVPGGQPVTVPNLPVPTPGTTLEPKEPIYTPPPIVPPDPDQRSVACIEIDHGDPAYVWPPPGFRYTQGYRKCVPCDGVGDNPPRGDAQCEWLSMEICIPNCTSPYVRIEPPITPEYASDVTPSTRRPSGPSDVVPPGILGRPITGYREWWFCNTSTGNCTSLTLAATKGQPAGSYSSSGACELNCIGQIGGERGIGTPLPRVPQGPTGIVHSREWWFCNTSTGTCTNMSLSSKRPQPAGSYDSKNKCETACVAQVSNNASPYTNAPNESTGSRGQIYTNAPNESTGFRGQIYTNAPNQSGSYGNPKIPSVGNTNQQSVGEPNVKVINVLQEEALQNPSNPNASVQGSQLYNPKYNFFAPVTNKSSPSNKSIFVTQSVFNNTVPASVANLVNNQGSNAVWDESFLSLSLDDVKASINPELLKAFRIIHFPGGQLVGETPFLEMLRKHLITGTMSEFDESFYLDLARSQGGDQKIVYTGLQNKEVSERAGLGVIASESVLASSDGQINLRKLQMRRQRRLNTDINAKCIVERTGHGVEKEQDLFLSDGGINVTTSGTQANFAVPTGEGDGYYMHINQIDLNSTPLVTTHDAASTYYVSDNTRYNALTLFRQSTEVTLTASSLESHNELVEGDTGVSALKPLYMPLDLESIGLANNSNPLVSTYTANYNVIEDQDLIDEHTKNNGMAITRVNIDYRDPLYRYILDSSSVSLSQNDINFKGVSTGKDYPGGILIAKNIPFGLIVTPVAGSKFNPFNGFSTINQYEPVIERSLEFRPSIKGSNPNPELKQENLYNSTGGELKVGLVEPNDTQNVLYKYEATSPLYTETFYRDGSYQTSSSPVSSTGTSFMVKDVIDYLYNTYKPNEVLWFDILRRMPLNRVGELFYDFDRELLNSLERGFRHNMKINYLLRTDKDLTSQILEDDEKVIIKKGDR